MIPVNNLDDQMFDDIVENSKKMIPSITDEWTNFSESDPGVTFIELFAWLKEMQQYYLNKIGIKNKLKYLKILGKKIEYGKPAHAIVNISNFKEEKLIPRGCKFSANKITFESTESISLLPINIVKFYSMSKDKILEVSERDWRNQYYIFGKEPKIGDQFYLCFDKPFPKDYLIKLMFNIYDKYDVKRNPINNEKFYPLAEIKWQYYSGGKWRNVSNKKDKTYGFITTGIISFSISNKMEEKNGMYLLRAVVKECNYDVPPVLRYVTNNFVELLQKETESEVFKFSSNGEKIQKYILKGYLSLYGGIEVFIKQDGYWIKINNYDTKIEDGNKIIIFDADKYTDVPVQGKENIKICCYQYGFGAERNLGLCDGSGNFSISVDLKDTVYDDFEIMISKGKEERWEEWHKVNELGMEGCTSKSYELDFFNDRLTFGDGINGCIPKGRIRIISYSSTMCSKGNVKRKEINNINLENFEGRIVNYDHAEGGEELKSIDELFKESVIELNEVTRAVTDDDYKEIVKSTPGLMIKDAKVIIPESQNSIFNNPDCIYIVAEAYNYMKNIGLNKAYIKNIRKNLEKYRLITTEIRIVEPEYIGVSVFIEANIKSYYTDAKKRIEDIVSQYFRNNISGFGKSIIYSEIYGEVESLECINFIESFTIEVQGKAARRASNGDLNLNENGIMYLKSCEVTFCDS